MLKLIKNNLWTMVICGQHGTMRTLSQSAQTVGPWWLCTSSNWQMGGQIQKQRQFLISANHISQGVPLSEGKPQVLGHEEKHKTVWKSPILSGRSHAKTNRILEGLQAISGFDRVLPDAIHWVTRIQWVGEKTAHIAQVNVRLLMHVIWMEIVWSRGFQSMA